MQFAIIFNPANLLLKHEVWYKGESPMIDSYGQLAGMANECRVAASFISTKRAENFVRYQQETRALRGQA